MATTQDNDTTEKPTYAIVSIRNMHLETWYKAGYIAKTKGVTLSKYIESLIEKDAVDVIVEASDEDTSNGE